MSQFLFIIKVIWETPLNRLDIAHILQTDPEFRRKTQKILAFCDIVALTATYNSNIRIRLDVNGEYIPINTNENVNETILPNLSILSKTLYQKWFGEDTIISDIVKDMVHFKCGENELGILTYIISTKIDTIIRKHDPTYIWYSQFIMRRLSAHLLV